MEIFSFFSVFPHYLCNYTHFNFSQFLFSSVVVVYPISMMAQSISVWLSVCISFERYLAICHPMKISLTSQTTKARQILVSVFVLSIFYNACRFWDYRWETIPETTELTLQPLLKANISYIRWYSHIVYLITMVIVPFVAMFGFSVAIVKTIRRSRNLR